MPPKDSLRLKDLGRADQARPEPGHPHQQRPVTAAQSKTRRRLPQSDVELLTEKQVLSLKPPPRLESARSMPSECRIAIIGSHDAMILPHDVNPGRIKFSERTGISTRDG